MKSVRFILSHPIQYFTPLFRELANQDDLDFEVWYCSDEGAKPMIDKGFGTLVQWDIPLLDGYAHRFFENTSRRPSIRYGFMGLWNPSLIKALRNSPKGTTFILHGWNYVTHLLVLLNARLYGHTLIFRGDNPDHHDRQLPKIKQFVKQIFIRPLLTLPNRVLYAGRRNYSFFRMYGVPDKKLVFAPHSVDNERFTFSELDLQARRLNMRKKWNLNDDAFVVLVPAKYIPKKRISDVIDAIAKITPKNIFLVLAGEGPSRSFLENRAQNMLTGRVIFTGFINQQEMPSVYAMADVLCLASGLGETWGLAVNEGMNCKLPLVLSHLCGCAEDLVIPGKNGFVYPCGDIDILASHLLYLYENQNKAKEMGQKSAEIVTLFSIQNTVKGIRKAIFNPS
jgi:glycosyltransferase involved in cell wall biosynthesis